MLVQRQNSSPENIVVSADFDKEHPYESIANFYNVSPYLSLQERVEFAVKVREFFKEMAYYDKKAPLPDGFKERFLSFDLDGLLNLIPSSQSGKHRMVATVEKVTGVHITTLKEKDQVYQARLPHSHMGRPLATGWGWLINEFVTSSKLKINSDDKTGESFVTLDDLSPSSQRALDQATNELSDGKNNLGELKDSNSEESLKGLLEFAKKWNLASLTTHLEFISSWGSGFGKKKQSLEESQQTTSRWFDVNAPIESIARFTDRFTILEKEEQAKFISTVCDFFRAMVVKGKIVEITDDFAKRFAVLDVPFLVDFLPLFSSEPNTDEYVRHRLIASIQQATKSRFLSLTDDNQLHQTQAVYGYEKFPLPIAQGWLKREFGDNSNLPTSKPTLTDLVRGYMPSEPLRLEGVYPNQAILLQQFQYPPIDLREVVAAGGMEAVIELLCHAMKWSMKPLQTEILSWLEKSEKPNIQELNDYLISNLHRDEVYDALVLMKLERRNGYLKPGEMIVSDKALGNILRFNLSVCFSVSSGDDLEKIIKFSFGKNPENSKVWGMCRKYFKEGTKARKIDKHIMEKVIAPAIKKTLKVSSDERQSVATVNTSEAFLLELVPSFYEAVRLCEGVSNSRIDMTSTLRLLKLKYEGVFAEKAKTVFEFLQNEDIVQLFDELGDAEVRKALFDSLTAMNDLVSHSEAVKKCVVEVKEALRAGVKRAPIDGTGLGFVFPEEFSVLISRLIELIEKTTDKSETKLKLFLMAFSLAQKGVTHFESDPITGKSHKISDFARTEQVIDRIVKFKPSDDLSTLMSQFYSTFSKRNLNDQCFTTSMSIDDAQNLVSILARQDVRAFLSANGFEWAEPLSEYLETLYTNNKCRTSFWKLSNLLGSLYEDMDAKKMEGMKSMFAELQSTVPNFRPGTPIQPQMLLQLLEKYSLTANIDYLYNEDYKISLAKDFEELHLSYVLRQIADAYMTPVSWKAKNFIYNKMLSSAKKRDWTVECPSDQEVKSFYGLRDNLSTTEAKQLIEILNNKDVCQIFSQNELSKSKEYVETILRRFIKEEEDNEKKNARKDSWFGFLG